MENYVDDHIEVSFLLAPPAGTLQHYVHTQELEEEAYYLWMEYRAQFWRQIEDAQNDNFDFIYGDEELSEFIGR